VERRREKAAALPRKKQERKSKVWRNHDEMYDENKIDAVIISTQIFNMPLHTVQAPNAKKDIYVEKPFAWKYAWMMQGG